MYRLFGFYIIYIYDEEKISFIRSTLFFVQNVTETEQFLARKSSLLQENLKAVQAAIAQKAKHADQVEATLRQRGL